MKHFLIVLFSLISFNAYSTSTLQGTYEGKLHMAQTGRTVNLKFFFNYVARTDTGDGRLTGLAGSFVIDDEGGPFMFSNVNFDLDAGLIDFRYNRPNRTRVYNTPAHLRFTGDLKLESNEKYTLTGEAVSGVEGPLGTFELKQISENTIETVTPKYFGWWQGKADLSGSVRDLSLNMAPSDLNVVNPEYMELDFTNGKTGSFTYMGTEFFLTVVHIDYLRGHVYLIDGTNPEARIILETDLDASGAMSGVWNSTYRGRTGTFTMRKIQ